MLFIVPYLDCLLIVSGEQLSCNCFHFLWEKSRSRDSHLNAVICFVQKLGGGLGGKKDENKTRLCQNMKIKHVLPKHENKTRITKT